MTNQHVIDLCADIARQASEFQKYVDEKISTRQKIVLFLGLTGSGKSTLVALLTGKELIVKEKTVKECELVCSGSGIGSGNKSVTKSPIIHKISESVSICDCPGFEDTEGEKEEILHAYQMFKLFGKENGKKLKIKIIFVVSDNELRSGRGVRVNGMMERIRQMFSNDSSIDSCLCLAITKCDCLDLAGNGYDAPLLKQFKENNIFLFPQPEIEDDGKVYETAKTHLDRLKSFVMSDSECLNDPEIKVSLNPKSELLLKEAENMEVEEITGMLRRIFHLFDSECREGFQSERVITDRIEYLEKQLETVKNLKESDDDCLTFVSKLRSIAKSEELRTSLDEALKRMTFICSFAKFIEVVLGSKKIADKFKKAKNNRCKRLIESLGNTIEKAELQENVEKLNKDLEQSEKEKKEAIEKLKEHFKNLMEGKEEEIEELRGHFKNLMEGKEKEIEERTERIEELEKKDRTFGRVVKVVKGAFAGLTAGVLTAVAVTPAILKSQFI